MNNKKEIIKLIIIIAIILGSIIYMLVSLKKDKEEYSYVDIFVNETLENTNDLEEDKETLEKIKVYITGEVNNPGVIELEEGARIEDAINMSGGITSMANLNKVNLAYVLEDGQKIYIPSINDGDDIEYLSTENGEGVIEETVESNEKININTADINELTNLPGVGEALAQRIVNYRNENGKFETLEDLKNVSGIGDKKFENIKEYIVIK